MRTISPGLMKQAGSKERADLDPIEWIICDEGSRGTLKVLSMK